MIEFSINKNCKMYNMGGVGIMQNNVQDFHSGLYNFKKKFGGFLQDFSYAYEIDI